MRAVLQRPRTTWCVALLVAMGAVLAACMTDYQRGLDDPTYGGPNALAGQQAPGPSLANTETDAGTTAPLCVRSGGTLVTTPPSGADGGGCTVSFAKDILGAFAVATPTCSQATCHGGTNPPNQPRVDTSDPQTSYAAFVQFQLDDKFYVNPCSTDPAASGMLCNFYSADDPKACGVHMPQSGQLAAEDIAKVEAWLKCGAPNN